MFHLRNYQVIFIVQYAIAANFYIFSRPSLFTVTEGIFRLHTEHTFDIISSRGDSMNVSKLANINIPQGRGMIKWGPFATMPEQFENVNKLIEQNAHVPKPALTNELQQELELKLRELVGKNVILRYWQDGYEYQVECVIESMDDWSRVVTVCKDDSFMFVQFEHIYSVDKYDYLPELY